MGKKSYAMEMVELIDPEKKYFQNKIIARNDCTIDNIKNLDVVMGSEKTTLIVDDTIEVWPSHGRNLIPIHRFN